MPSSVGYSAGSANLTPAEIAGAGATSGFITRMLTQPLDVLKIRFQLQVESTRHGAGGQYYGLLQGGLRVVREEGLKALWRGHVAAQALTVLYGAGQFWCYNFATRTCHERNKLLALQHAEEKKNHCNNCNSVELDAGIKQTVCQLSRTSEEKPKLSPAIIGAVSNSDTGLRVVSSQCAQSITGLSDETNRNDTPVTSRRVGVSHISNGSNDSDSDRSCSFPNDSLESLSSHNNSPSKFNLSVDKTHTEIHGGNISRSERSFGIFVSDNCTIKSPLSRIQNSGTATNARDDNISICSNHLTNPVNSNDTSYKTLVSDTIDNRNSYEGSNVLDNRTYEAIAQESIGHQKATSEASSTKGFNESDSAAVTVSQMSFCGGVAGLCGTLVSMPCDVARTRIVAQSTKKYRGLLDVWGQMRRQEGLTSLWRGLLPTIASSAPFAAIQFPVYSSLMTFTEGWATTKGDGLMWRSPVAGCTAGLVAKMVVYPLDLLKKRSQMRGAEHLRQHFGKVVTYGSSLDIVRRVTLEEGAMAWFKGLSPALVKSALVSALAFSTFEAVCLLLRAVHGTGAGVEQGDDDEWSR